ncbi:unnamed protein product [Didymodactylos carnosus]|uniref:EGF-like domain-containing protein n=1 Tax=Didymodactylos carnosus TaxID=1234261 RepID=A0A8S2DU29_9BILA|nr:unnamed protein product [Didymodactylos carnosus]CAF3769866.1 unnamed protein product [Didymodactylos carnosus]
MMSSIQFIIVIVVDIFILHGTHALSVSKHREDIFEFFNQIKDQVNEGKQCLPGSMFYQGSCYSYISNLRASSWDTAVKTCAAFNSKLIIGNSKLLIIETIDEYKFVEQLIRKHLDPHKTIFVFINLRKLNGTFPPVYAWGSNGGIYLWDTPVYRYWNENVGGPSDSDCGIMRIMKNKTDLSNSLCDGPVISLPYICKYTIDRCYNNSACGKYGTCLNVPLLDSHKCQCRFLYSGNKCEKCLQALIGAAIILIAFITSYIINMDRSGTDTWSFRCAELEQYQTASLYTSKPLMKHRTYLLNSTVNHVIRNPILNQQFTDITTTTTIDELSYPSPAVALRRHDTLIRPFERKQRYYAFRRSIQKLQIKSCFKDLFIKPKKLIFVFLPIVLAIVCCLLIIILRRYIKSYLYSSHSSHSTLFKFCSLYENNYYINLVTLPIAFVLILLITFEKGLFRLQLPIPYNPFSKINRFDTVALCGIISHEILHIIEELFINTTQIKVITMRGPLFDLIRQIGLVIIIGMRYYPIYSIVEMNQANIIYYGLCSVYMWIDFTLKISEQALCSNIGPFIKTWNKFHQLKHNLTQKHPWNDMKHKVKEHFVRNSEIEDDDYITSTIITTTTTTQFSTTFDPSLSSLNEYNWSHVFRNLSFPINRNHSTSTFDQFGLDSTVIGTLKYLPYYLCLTYICFRLTYLFFRELLKCIQKCFPSILSTSKKSKKHIYHEPNGQLSQSHHLSIEYQYVQHLFCKTRRKLQKIKKVSFIQNILYRIYRPNKYFHYSKQILNMYIIAFMITYYLTFNILQGGFYLIEKCYRLLIIPIILTFDELDLPKSRPFNLKYEILLACFLTMMIYYVQLFIGMKHYQQNMLNAYKGI